MLTLFGILLLWFVLGAVIFWGSPEGKLDSELFAATPYDKPAWLSLGNRLNAFYLALYFVLHSLWIALRLREAWPVLGGIQAIYLTVILGRRPYYDE